MTNLSIEDMAAITPRRSLRNQHQHTPKMSERKKGLFQSDSDSAKESLTKHRQLTVLDSESESDDCDLGIMGALDSSSCDENDSNVRRTPERTIWHTRSQTKKILKENRELKNFIKSPFTLKKYQTRYSCPEKCTGSVSTPATPHLQNQPGTPSSSHSCTSIHTTSSTSSRARKSLAGLIADAESCSSSLKDLNFDTDSGTDSKENTPSKSLRKSSRRHKMTPKLQSFKGVLLEQKKNISPVKKHSSPIKNPIVYLTKMDFKNMLSPTQMLKTPHNMSGAASPPKIGHSRRSIIIDESPNSADKNYKRHHYDSMSEQGPNPKHPRLDNAPKARLSLFNSDRLKEILSAKSFYGKSNPELNKNVTAKISHAIQASTSHRRRLFPPSHSRRKKRPGQINMGVRHSIRKPKVNKTKMALLKGVAHSNASKSQVNSTASNSFNDTLNTSMAFHNTSQDIDNEKADPFDKEKQTIDALLSQWTEEEVPESETVFRSTRAELPCFNSAVMEETRQIFQPVTAVKVADTLPQDNDVVIVELGAQNQPLQDITKLEQIGPESHQVGPVLQQNCTGLQDITMVDSEGHRDSHGEVPKSGQFLPVEGGYILVAPTENPLPVVPGQEDVPDLDAIEKELKMLDEQIRQMAHSNNINPEALLASTEPCIPNVASSSEVDVKEENHDKLFPIFCKPNPGPTSTPSSKGTANLSKKSFLKTGHDQYVIDAGQKKFGATQCTECGVIYQIGDPQDEHDHLVHHNATDVLKFNAMKDEYVCGVSGSARCVRVRGGEAGWRRVEALLDRVVHPQLGYGAALSKHMHAYTAYLYIDKKQIVGCLIAEIKTKAHKLIPGDPDCCSLEEFPVKCGISRVWTHKNYRRRGLASRLLDCARASFLYGEALTTEHLAFSAPTAAGRALATHYCGTENFYVYID